MKAILVIDAPNNCSECPCFHEGECGNKYKGYVGDYLGWDSGRPSWCPLKPMPTRVGHEEGLDSVFNIGWEHGYNACLDDLGETE